MINRVGLTGAVKNSSPNQQNLGDILGEISNLNSKMIVGRVKDIILDETHPKFQEYGGWNAVGTIFYELVNFTSAGSITFAKPFFPQIKTYPLIGELVLLLALPNTNIGQKTSSESYYYLNNINLWNHPHHNAYPGVLDQQLPPQQSKDYQQVGEGSVRRVSDGSTEINLNGPYNNEGKFIEKTNIHPLLSFNGDVVYEGRFGNSLRFGNTLKSNSSQKNIWSEEGKSGDPITIIRNGQPNNVNEEGWVPITENINNDLSSLWLTSYQKVPMGWDNKFKSFSPKTTPKILSQYNNPQLIVNTSRIILNASTSDVLISSGESTSITSKYVNIDSNNVYVDGENIKLGSKNATEPIILGDTFLGMFSQLLFSLENIMLVLEKDQIYPGGTPVPNALLNSVATNTKEIIQSLKSELENAKSKISKTA